MRFAWIVALLPVAVESMSTTPESAGTYLDDLELPPDLKSQLQATGKLRDQASERYCKMMAFYDGFDVAVQSTPRGPLIVASGPSEEVAAVLEQLSDDQRKRLTLFFPGTFHGVGNF